jgi:NADPH-dependent 7-cyano-7-deazaguanine reductase QueF
MVIFVFYRILLLFFFSFQDCNQKHEKIKNKIRNKILPRFVSRHS